MNDIAIDYDVGNDEFVVRIDGKEAGRCRTMAEASARARALLEDGHPQGE